MRKRVALIGGSFLEGVRVPSPMDTSMFHSRSVSYIQVSWCKTRYCCDLTCGFSGRFPVQASRPQHVRVRSSWKSDKEKTYALQDDGTIQATSECARRTSYIKSTWRRPTRPRAEARSLHGPRKKADKEETHALQEGRFIVLRPWPMFLKKRRRRKKPSSSRTETSRK